MNEYFLERDHLILTNITFWYRSILSSTSVFIGNIYILLVEKYLFFCEMKQLVKFVLFRKKSSQLLKVTHFLLIFFSHIEVKKRNKKTRINLGQTNYYLIFVILT